MAEELSRYAEMTTGDWSPRRGSSGIVRDHGQFPSVHFLSLLYFATASFAEMPVVWGSPTCRLLSVARPPAVQREVDEPSSRALVGAQLQPTSCARSNLSYCGLGRAERRNWYAADAEDYFRGRQSSGQTGRDRPTAPQVRFLAS